MQLAGPKEPPWAAQIVSDLITAAVPSRIKACCEYLPHGLCGFLSARVYYRFSVASDLVGAGFRLMQAKKRKLLLPWPRLREKDEGDAGGREGEFWQCRGTVPQTVHLRR